MAGPWKKSENNERAESTRKTRLGIIVPILQNSTNATIQSIVKPSETIHLSRNQPTRFETCFTDGVCIGVCRDVGIMLEYCWHHSGFVDTDFNYLLIYFFDVLGHHTILLLGSLRHAGGHQQIVVYLSMLSNICWTSRSRLGEPLGIPGCHFV